MTDSRYRSAVREGLDPLVSEVGEGPEWDDLTNGARIEIRGRRLPGWALAGVTALVVLVGLGLPALLSGPLGGGPSADGKDPASPVAFSETQAQETVNEWWHLVIAGDVSGASDLSHPDAEFNYAGLSEWVSAARDTPPVTVDDRVFGTGEQPQLCFALGEPSDQIVGSAVFRTFEEQWRLWEIRTNTSGCVAWAESLDTPVPDDDSKEAAILAERMAETVEDLGGLCRRSSAKSDFDGDGTADLATIGTADCGAETDIQGWTMVVVWGYSGTDSWPLDSCGVVLPEGRVRPTGMCQVLAAPDLNDDGRAELMVKVQQAAGSISLFQLYVLTPDEPSQEPMEVAPGGPGPDEITPGQIFVATFGASPNLEENIQCTTNSEGDPVFLMTVAESDGNQWSVFEGTWRLDGGLVAFMSQRTYTETKDSPQADSLIAGANVCGAPILEP